MLFQSGNTATLVVVLIVSKVDKEAIILLEKAKKNITVNTPITG